MAQVNQEANIIQQFDRRNLRQIVRRLAQLRRVFWQEMRAHGARVYPTFEEQRTAILRMNAIFHQIIHVCARLRDHVNVPPPPLDIEREAIEQCLRTIGVNPRWRPNPNRRIQRIRQPQRQPPENDDPLKSEVEEENGNNQG